MPYTIQKAIKASCGDRNEIIGGLILTVLPKACHIDLPPTDIARAADTRC